MKKLFCLLLVACVSSGWQSAFKTSPDPAQPPVAQKVPKTITLHGDTRVDDYFWLRQKTNPEVIAYLKAENAYTDAMMRPTEALQAKLYKEMVGRIKESDLTVPTRRGDYFYYSRTEQGKQYRIMCRKRGSLEAKEEVLLDLNALARGKKFLALGAYEVSPDGALLAYSIDNTGFRESFLFIKDLRTGQVLPDRLGKVDEAGIVWANDNRTLFYVEQDGAKRPYRLYRHVLGTPKASDVLVYEEKDERFNLYPSRSRSGVYLFATLQSNTTSEVRYLSLDRPTEPLKIMHAREANHEYYADHHGDLFYIRTNDQGRNYRLVTAPVSDPGKQNWKEVIPHRVDVMLEGLDCFAQHFVVYERENTLLKARITDVRSGETHRLEFSEPVYEAFLDTLYTPSQTNPEFNTTLLRFSFQSFTVPPSVYDYDMASRERKLLKRTEVLGGYDPQHYQSERMYATSSDGRRVPISLVYKKGFTRDGHHPMLLTGYGSYGFPELVTFDSSIFSLLDRGFVYAIAHVRGGGERGKLWHDQGRMLAKKNTFTDFIAAAEHLIAERYTAKDRLVIIGASAGGLLMGAVTNMRPDLFKAVVALVPFVDVLNTMMDPTLPLTVAEYEEWGNPNIKAEYDYIKSYSPYDNIERKDYPAILVKTSLNDSQVMYWEPAKYVAKLRAMKTDKNVLLLKTDLDPAGHGGKSGRYERLRETAFLYAFILSQVGAKE